jgi:hypothetical protein
MKKWMFFLFALHTAAAGAQQLQLHYDFRHTTNPALNRRNFPSLSFEYFKEGDSTGSFLLKAQTDLNGEKKSPGQAFFQLSKSLRFWKPKIFLTLNYSGGLGVAPPAYGYYINNSFGAGVAKNVFWKGTVLSFGLLYRYNSLPKASHDAQLNFYFWKGFLNYRLQVSGSIVAFTQNRDIGTEFTKELHGKKIAFYGDPQIWWKLRGKTSIGTRLSLYYHVLTEKNQMQVYPTVGVKQEF